MNSLSFLYFAMLALASIPAARANNGLLRVAVNIVPPFSILKSSISNGTYHQVTKEELTGLEVELFDLIAQSFNINVQYYALIQDTDFYYGNFFLNGTSTGMLHDLKQKKFDALIGYIRLVQDIKGHFEVMTPWIRDQMMYCFRKEYVNVQWMTFFETLSPTVHLYTTCLTIVAILIFWKQENYSIVSALGVAMLLVYGCPVKLPKERISRIAVSCLIFYQLFLITSFISSCISKLSDPQMGYKLFPSTVDDLFENNLKLHYSPYDNTFLADFGEHDLLKNSQICRSYKECTEAVIKDRSSYTLLSSILVQYRQDSPLFNQLKCIKDQKWKIRFGLFFILGENSSLPQKFMDAVLRVQAYGINQALLNRFFKTSRATYVNVIGNQISMNHLMPSFYVMFLGYFEAGLALLGEWMVYLVKKREKKRANV